MMRDDEGGGETFLAEAKREAKRRSASAERSDCRDDE